MSAFNVAALGDSGEALWGLGGLWIIKVSAEATAGSFSLIEVRIENRGRGRFANIEMYSPVTACVREGRAVRS